MRITRSQLSRIIKQEVSLLGESINDQIAAYNGEFFELVDAVRELSQKMGVEPAELCTEVTNTLRASGRRRG